MKHMAYLAMWFTQATKKKTIAIILLCGKTCGMDQDFVQECITICSQRIKEKKLILSNCSW